MQASMYYTNIIIMHDAQAIMCPVMVSIFSTQPHKHGVWDDFYHYF